MRAFGFASFCAAGGCCCRSQMLPKSLEPSGVNGRTMGFIEPRIYDISRPMSKMEHARTHLTLAKTSRSDSGGYNHIP